MPPDDDDDLDVTEEISLHDQLSSNFDELSEIDDDLDTAATDAGAPPGDDVTQVSSSAADLGEDASPDDLSAVDATDANTAGEESPSTTDDDDDHADDTPGTEPIVPPADMSDDDLAAFEALPRGSQEFIARRYGEMTADYTRKSQDVATERETLAEFRGISEVFAPHEQYLRMNGLTPVQYTQQLLSVGQYIRENPIEGIRWLARQNGIPLDRLGGDGEYDNAAEDPVSDPRLDTALNRIGHLEQNVANVAQTAEQQALNSAQGMLDAFQNAVDDQGKPAHPHFEDVRARMSQLMVAGIAPSMEDAYDQAIHLDPVVRAKLAPANGTTNGSAPAAATNGKTTQARINQAKKAASPVSGDTTGGGGGETLPPVVDSIRDQLSQDWDALMEESA